MTSTPEKLLRAARKCLIQRGHRACTVQEVARVAGVNHALVFHHFGSKEGLFIALLEAEDKRIHQQKPPAHTPRGIAQMMVQLNQGGGQHQQLMMEMVALSRQMPQLSARLNKGLQLRQEELAGIFGVNQQTAALLLAATMGLAVRQGLDPHFQLEEALSQLFDTLLATRPEPPVKPENHG